MAMLESASAFQAPALKAVSRTAGVSMFSEGDIGVLPPLGVYDPLGLIESRNMARYEIMEIKHGRAAMLGFLHVILIEAGAKFPTADCEAAPTGLIASLESMPTFAWLQIMLICCMAETGWGGRSDGIVSQFGFGEAQTTEKEPGDIGGRAWIRYDDPGEKAFKLNAQAKSFDFNPNAHITTMDSG